MRGVRKMSFGQLKKKLVNEFWGFDTLEINYNVEKNREVIGSLTDRYF